MYFSGTSIFCTRRSFFGSIRDGPTIYRDTCPSKTTRVSKFYLFLFLGSSAVLVIREKVAGVVLACFMQLFLKGEIESSVLMDFNVSTI